MEEEYENQQSWRTSHDKLTFIICQPLSTPATADLSDREHGMVQAGEVDASELMIGDINFFIYPNDDDEADENGGSYVGEVDIMVAAKNHRGKGVGYAAVTTLLTYVHQNKERILKEYVEGEGMNGGIVPVLKGLMVKIKEGNVASIALFRRLGFTQKGEVNYFGEIQMVLEDFDQFVASPAGATAAGEYHEAVYSR